MLIYDDFRADNEGTVRRVLRFLEVDEDAPVEVTEANPTIRMRSQKLRRDDGRGDRRAGPGLERGQARRSRRSCRAAAPEACDG